MTTDADSPMTTPTGATRTHEQVPTIRIQRNALLITVLATLISTLVALLFCAGVAWFWLPRAIGHALQDQPETWRVGTVDIAALYAEKEAEVTAALLRSDASAAQRAQALQAAADYGTQMTRALQTLSTNCGCLVLTRGALIGVPPGASWTDLTPSLRAALATGAVGPLPPSRQEPRP